MSKVILPQGAIDNHIAVVGKTGTGKTITVKLIIEQLVPNHDRVVILDPIKSDYRGLVSSADGKHAGLPFYILGGPFGHVPLHPGAGKAIGEIVAKGQLPLSILDMKEFPPGGLYEFFSDFAPTILSKIRGILYVVMEEAHLFAPKERSGLGKENWSIHWAKQLATGGRSAGIRLIVTTQRTQALHNAILGACETMITHRLTAPADQEPVLKWFSNQAGKGQMEEVRGSIAGLEKGEAWVCSGEGKLFERRQMPMIWTFDNTKTPSRKDVERQRDRVVATAEVDLDKLRSVIGEAIVDVEANDPKKLRARVAELTAQLAKAAKTPAVATVKVSLDDKTKATLKEKLDKLADFNRDVSAENARLSRLVERVRETARKLIEQTETALKVDRPKEPPSIDEDPARPVAPRRTIAPSVSPGTAEFSKLERAMLTAFAQHPEGLSKAQVLTFAGYSRSGNTSTAFARFLNDENQRPGEEAWIEDAGGGNLRITGAGVDALGEFEPLPTGAELRRHWCEHPAFSTLERAIMTKLCELYPDGLTKAELLESIGYQRSGNTSTAFAKFLRMNLAMMNGAKIQAHHHLYPG